MFRTTNPFHKVSDQHTLTYFPFNQLDTRFHLFFRKSEAAVKGEFRVNMFIYDVDHSMKQVQLRKLVREDDPWKRNYRTQMRFDPHNDVKKKHKSVEIITSQDT